MPPTYLNHYSRVSNDSSMVDVKSRDLLTKTSFTIEDGRLVAKTESARITASTSERPVMSDERLKLNEDEPEIKGVSGKDDVVVLHEVVTQSPRKRKEIEVKCDRVIKRLKKAVDPKQSSILTYFSAKSPKKVQDPARKMVLKSENAP